ncbi:MAG: LytR C-terminal domain-containing protein [Actinomycetota bacterium]|nr:LytR C-terminal domain-containing protein [Actinomycetota bacterium]
MNPAPPAARTPSGGRWQGVVAVVGLLAAVVVTVAMVATPASSSADGRPAAETARANTLPGGVRVEIVGGEAIVAYGVADRLADAGASLKAVRPVSARSEVEESTMIVYYDRRSLATAEGIRSMLGRGTLRRQQAFQPSVDVTVVLGKDLARL